MRKIGLMLALALYCLAANGATFTLSGDSGLTGSVVIDTTTGLATSLNVSYAGDTFTFSGLNSLGPSVIDIEGMNGPRTKFLHLIFQLSSLAGYTGGNLCGTNNYAGGGAVSEVYTLTGTGSLIQLSHVTLN